VSDLLKKIDSEEELPLEPEKPGYPWQILEAEGETWVIVRWKDKVATQPLQGLEGVDLKSFSWELVAEHEEKSFYVGEINLQINYQETGVAQMEWEWQEPWVDEFIFYDSLFTEKAEEMSAFPEENSGAKTAFASLLIEGNELKEYAATGEAATEMIKSYEVLLPWRCWLKGKGKNETPVLKKVHLTQVGVYTLLLEALIKLEKKQEFTSTIEDNLTTIVEEEITYELTNDSIFEIMGVPVERGFWRYRYDPRRESLLLRARNKTNLIYVSAESGGERFSIASGTGEEEAIMIKGVTKPIYPVGLEIRCEQMQQGLVGTNKIVYQGKYLYCLQKEPQQKKEKAIVTPVTTESEVAEAQAVLSPEPLKRNRPGERWMKKKECSDKWGNRTIITIKL